MRKTKARVLKRMLAMTVALTLLLGTLPTAVFANDPEPSTMTVIVSVTDSDTGSEIEDAEISVAAPEEDVTIDGYTITLPAETTQISFTVIKEGYTEKQMTDVAVEDGDTVDVELNAIVPVTTTITVDGEEGGTATVNGEGSATSNPGEEVEVVICPDEGWYLADCDGMPDETEWTDEGFDGTISPLTDTDITVTFAKYLEVSANETVGGSIRLTLATDEPASDPLDEPDETEETALLVKSGETVRVSFVPNESYWLSSAAGESELGQLDDFDDFDAEQDKNGYTKDVVITSDTVFSAEFAEFFTVTITANENGVITPDGGTVSLLKGEDNEADVTATPNIGYRVAEVSVNDVSESFTENNQTYSSSFSENTTVIVTFSPNRYSVSIPEPTEGGTVTTDKTVVQYGGSVTVTITPTANSDITSVLVNDVEQTWTWVSTTSAAVTISDVSSDLTVEVTYAPIDVVEEPGDITDGENAFVSIDTSATLVEEQYVYRKDATLTLSAKSPYTAMRVNGIELDTLSPTYTITSSMTLETVDLFDTAWHRITLDEPMEIVIDKAISKPTLTPDELATGLTHYNDDVAIVVSAADSISGIQSISYAVVANDDEDNPTQEGTLYTYENGQDVVFDAASLSEETRTVTVDSALNNYDDVKVIVTLIDRAGNEETEIVELKINADAPTIQMEATPDKTGAINDMYFSETRTVTLMVVDRNSTFDEARATAAISLLRVEKDTDTPTEVEDGVRASMLSAWTTDAEDDSIHSITIMFSSDGFYQWSVDYTNLAGSETKAGDAETPDADFCFVIDTVAPTGKIGYQTNRWNLLLEKLTFGLWKNFEITVSVSDLVDNSAVDIRYYISKGETVNEEYLKQVPETPEETDEAGDFCWKDEATLDFENRFVVYARLTDRAGHVTYISTQGIVIDESDPVITATPDDANEYGYYNDDVTVRFRAEDPGDFSGGLASVTYQVFADYTDTTAEPTQSGDIYVFTPSDEENGVAEPDELVMLVESSDDGIYAHIVVDSELNNTDNVRVIITATDNAGNTKNKIIDMAINTVVPTVDVSFVADSAVTTVDEENTAHGYFGATRTATVTITDRNTTFHAANASNAVKATITAKDGAGATVDTYTLSEWETDSVNSGVHTATLTFLPDALYIFDVKHIAYTNKASLTSGSDECTVSGTTPHLFTVDATKPDSGSMKMNETGEGDTGWEQTWNQLLSKLTFGIYKRIAIRAEATGTDALSPLRFTYYVTEEVLQKSEAELDALTFSEEAPTVDPEKVVVVYAKISDYAGNHIYRQTDGAILDTKKPTIDLTLRTSSHNGIFNQDVKFDIRISDEAPSSGIKSVTYRVVRDENTLNPTQNGTLFSFNKTDPVFADLITELDSTKSAGTEFEPITVSSSLNNSCNVVLYVTAVDNAGNETSYFTTTDAAGNVTQGNQLNLDIDTTPPKVTIRFDNNSAYNDKYFSYAGAEGQPTRTATVVITERTHHFDEAYATKILKEAITARNLAGRSVNDSYAIGEWATTKGSSPNQDTHTISVKFIKDANYTFTPTYTDKANNASPKEAQYEAGTVAGSQFVIDNTPPQGSVNIKTKIDEESGTQKNESWDRLVQSLTFGFWTPNDIVVSGTAFDETSPLQDIGYYMATGDSADKLLDKVALDRLSPSDWTRISINNTYDVTTITPDNKCVVYVRVTDKAGHTTYISTNGMVADKSAPLEEYLAPEVFLKTEGEDGTVYNDDVIVSVKVIDPRVNEAYSGIKWIDYQITGYNVDGSEANTETGRLFAFEEESPKAEELCYSKELEIPVKAEAFNSNDVRVTVSATDNAGNASSNSISLMIDKTAPTIEVEYDNNNGDGDENRYFSENRTMIVKVRDRNFDASLLDLQILGASEPTWTLYPASAGNGDETVHQARIAFTQDADYTVSMSCRDVAGNVCDEADVVYNGIAPTVFTIDKTLPAIAVSYDNNDARNGNYYRADRTATITVREHNFDASRVEIIGSGINEGTAVSYPELSGWRSEGDTHTASIHYSSDALYSFDIEVNDKAGNGSEDYSGDQFYIDKTMPELRFDGVLNHSANKDVVAPTITFTDANFDANGVSMPLVGVNNGKVAFEASAHDINNGRVYTYADFEHEKRVDDLYTLSASVVDLAGNETDDQIMFSVNRFGSVYVMKGDTLRINNTYIKEPTDVVIKEINPDRLEETKVTLFKNDRVITLVEGSDYRVDYVGGEGQWYEYTYTIFAKNFNDDGVYRVVLHSLDAAGNIAENTLDTKDAPISFGVDMTNPTLTVINLESGMTYPAEIITVNMLVNDNLVLSNVRVYLDDYTTVYAEWREDEIASLLASGGEFSFEISGDSKKAHKLLIVCSDSAGNETVEEYSDFFVTTDVLVRYYNNKPVFYGSLGAVGISIIALVLVKTRGAVTAAEMVVESEASIKGIGRSKKKSKKQ